ncbi:MAG: glycosyltransferase family 2 protein [Acetobacteraceae bacterium]|nr:glycosyltransferase family 2 protein [Acetobacteraceae bacterium]
MSRHVVVIIPFFQRIRGLLSSALRGVFDQRDAPEIRVIVVDDESPIPAAVELLDIDPGFRHAITVIRQPNAGPASARNTGLAAVTAGGAWIALLDSDDLWTPDHIARAVTNLEKHGNIYFSDGSLPRTGSTLFETAGFRSAEHHPIDGQSDIFALQGDYLSLLVDRSPFVTSSAVYRADVFGGLRFEPSCGICDDLAFWMSIASLSPSVVFSSRVEVFGADAAEHISIVEDWKSNKALRVSRDLIRYYNFALRTVPLSEEHRAKIRRKAANERAGTVITAMAMVKDRIPLDRGLVRDCLRESPAPAIDLLRGVTQLIRSRIIKRWGAPEGG